MIKYLLTCLMISFTCAAGFPKNFIFGTATASYQIEGAWNEDGKGQSWWDKLSHTPGKISNDDNGDVACDFYHRYEQDISYMASLGLKHFRMSISWPRVLPQGTGQPNQKGIDFYNKVFDLLLANGITPYVTLYHWDFPDALNQNPGQDGWLNPKVVEWFTEYADLCFSSFGDRVKYWLTVNEPFCITALGYGNGQHAPNRCSDRTNCPAGDSATEPYIANHNLILSHASAVNLYRKKYQATQKGRIGLTINQDFGLPFDPSSQADKDAAERTFWFQWGWFAHPIVYGDYPDIMKNSAASSRLPKFTDAEKTLIKGTYDYLGLNHYSTHYFQNVPTQGTDYFSDVQAKGSDYDMYGNFIGPSAQSIWLRVYGPGIRGILNWINKNYQNPEIIIMENGVSVPNENELPKSVALDDSFRIKFYQSYLENVRLAIQDGVNVTGYFAWSFMDNFEWAMGYQERFGLIYVDYKNGLTRTPKISLLWYLDFIRKQQTLSENENEFEE